jgi:hypothetical protein
MTTIHLKGSQQILATSEPPDRNTQRPVRKRGREQSIAQKQKKMQPKARTLQGMALFRLPGQSVFGYLVSLGVGVKTTWRLFFKLLIRSSKTKIIDCHSIQRAVAAVTNVKRIKSILLSKEEARSLYI